MIRGELCYALGPCRIALQAEACRVIEEKFLLFATEQKPTCKITFLEKEEVAHVIGQNMVTEDDVTFSEYEENGEFIRTFHGMRTNIPYAVLRKTGEQSWECSYLKDFQRRFTSVEKCFSHLALERILMEEGAAILHASFIRFNGEGILFTGVSGIGKSTQAALWEKHEDAEILNGDRTILYKEENIWYGYGSPYAGSSGIFRNEKAPIKAIVALGQDHKENVCVRLSGGEAFRKIYAGVTLNTWNSQHMGEAVKLISDLCLSIPVYFLKCKPDTSAIECLKKALKEQ